MRQRDSLKRGPTMFCRKYKLIIFGLGILLVVGMYGNTTYGQSSSIPLYDPGRVTWTYLSFQAKNFWVEVSTHMQFTSLPAANVEALLLPSPRGAPIRPTAPQASQMTINTIIDPKFRSPVSIYNRIWFDPTNASALGRIRLRRGEDDFKKTYRFTNQGVFRHQLEPKDKKEAAFDPDKWSKIKDSFYPYDLSRLGCHGATERSLLVYILSAADFTNISNSFALCAFGKRQLHRVKLQPEGRYPLNVKFIERTPQSTILKEQRINALKIAISAEPLESNLNEVENFSFLGLHPAIAIYIDPATRYLLQVSGDIPTVGTVHLKLNEVQTK
jgi:hypothetical protein